MELFNKRSPQHDATEPTIAAVILDSPHRPVIGSPFSPAASVVVEGETPMAT
jgi:hypothetical protein